MLTLTALVILPFTDRWAQQLSLCNEPVALHLQRALLERLTGMVSTPVGDAVPAGVVALEAMRLIIDVVGEVSSDEVHRMRQPCITKLTAHPQPLQFQVGLCKAVLPTANTRDSRPPSASD